MAELSKEELKRLQDEFLAKRGKTPDANAASPRHPTLVPGGGHSVYIEAWILSAEFNPKSKRGGVSPWRMEAEIDGTKRLAIIRAFKDRGADKVIPGRKYGFFVYTLPASGAGVTFYLDSDMALLDAPQHEVPADIQLNN